MYPILKNLISVIRRFQLASILNVLGLSVAFAAFMVIMIQLEYDYNFDRFHKDYDKIFRLESGSSSTEFHALFVRPFAELFIESSPHIVAGTIVGGSGNYFFYVVEIDGKKNYYIEWAKNVSPEFSYVFDFDFIDGDKDALKTPNTVMIPLSLSQKIFGSESAVGKHFNFGPNFHRTVGAVYRDFPRNSILQNAIYAPIPDDENKDNWGNSNYEVYIRVNESSNASLLFDNFKLNSSHALKAGFGEDFEWDDPEIEDFQLRLTSLPDIHFATGVIWDNTPKASKQTMLILFSIAIVIIVIAGINFTNFTTALSPMRIKNINTQKVFGASQTALRLSILFEAVFFCLISYLIAIVLISELNETPLAKLVDADLSISANWLIVIGTALIALLTGIFAGIYPTFYMTSFPAAFVLKGSFGLSPKGKQLRNTLLCIQFISSFALIIGASFMYLQNYYMRQYNLGYDKDKLLTVNVDIIQGSSDALTDKLKTHSGIEDVTYGAWLLSSGDRYMLWGGINYKGEEIDFQVFPVHHTFIKVLGIEIIGGREFRYEDTQTLHGAFIFNETAQKKYNLETNTNLEVFGTYPGTEIVGFMSDLKFASCRTTIEPMAFIVYGTENKRNQHYNAYIRVKADTDIRETMSFIKSTLAEFDANYDFNVRFYDDILQRLYEQETSLSSLILIFSFIAIFISIVGVFGLVVFDSQCRRKEIGIRKVHGAKSNEIIFMFNKVYFLILIICFVVATPLAWFAVDRWLQNFAYKTPMFWWVYLIAFISVSLITIGTVTFQNWRAANENPVRAINSN
ncbi:MAG: FtsX-like permease family protein [Marinilabiliaceae bacterium]|nr:FtsX-like permease family protein [Marinilabiliaceae bacterium]